MRFYYFDFFSPGSYATSRELGKSFSGGRSGGGGCVGDRGREQGFWELGEAWGAAGRVGRGWEGKGGEPVSGTSRGAEKQGARVTSILFDLELIICK